ncbi:pseudouridine synthase [Desulfosarcina alkanivorans]|uniref:Pseudouridine synthase n=1 Tax=Desulfosarcina alkanivorans TaxID=571177 RepID=A0A5K7YUL6_9BACT|nr:RluA family pseudouridine synthase [Desulfosarcina alkanivorans]BBO71723.1 pseudouridine synthase [Desulfosarcina alkanivorans]
MSNPPSSFSFCVRPAQAGVRLDVLVAAEVNQCSRSFAAALIRKGCIAVDGAVKKPRYPLRAGETVSGTIPAPEHIDSLPEDIPLQILYEDAELLVLNKAAGMVVHPAPGHPGGTLVNALMHHCSDLAGISGTVRPGIVHRLDKDTSGALVVAKNSRSMHHLAGQFKSRRVRKNYLALVYGIPKSNSGSIDQPIGRHPVERKKMSVTTHTPRSALTHWQVRETFSGASLLDLDIRTGRTHQIRVHCKFMGHPLIGDPIYGRRGERKRLADTSIGMRRAVIDIHRQMLHAWRISFDHPTTGRRMKLEAALPEDMAQLIDRFRILSASEKAQE